MRTLLLATTFLLTAPVSAQIMAGPSDDVESLLNGLSPGDEVILADGMYTLSGRFSFTAIGTEAEPILIRAADGATPHFHRPDASQNIWDITNAEHVVILGLEFSGGSAGLRIEAATNLTIEDCHIHDTDDVALRMNDGGVLYRRVFILRNHIHDTHGTGEGMYLGCNNNGCQVAESVIAGNYVHHTNAGDVSQGDGIELKEGSYGNVIRDNVIHDTNYPCILGYSTVGNGAPNVVERNVLWNCGDHAIQWAADAVIRNNIVLSAAGSGIASQPHQSGAPSNLEIVHNTVVMPNGPALSLRNGTGSVTVANNALYAQTGAAILVRGDSSMFRFAGNVGEGGLDGLSTPGLAPGAIAADFVDARYSGGVPNDVFPAAGGALVAAGDPSEVAPDDFNGTDRMGVADVGAYAYGDGSNPGWVLAEGFKPAAGDAPPPVTDAGTPVADAGVEPGRDAGTPPRADSGTPGGDGGVEESGGDGCGCRATPRSGLAGWFVPALLGLLVFRSRSRPRG